MAITYKTPGVYVEEIATLPASVAQVETAIPAFIGYTERAEKNGQPIFNKPTKIESMIEYEEYFGGGGDIQIEVDLNTDNSVNTVNITRGFYLYDSLRMFFSNGGGQCYIVAVNSIALSANVSADMYDELKAGLDTLKKEDEPTLILSPDAVNLDASDLGTFHKDALAQCNLLQDRFCIFDVPHGDLELDDDSEGDTPDAIFRNNVGVQYLKYGAAYYPYLKTTLSFDFGYENITSLTKNTFAVSLEAISKDATYVNQMKDVLTDRASMNAFYNAPADDALFSGVYDVAPINTLGLTEGFTAITDVEKDSKNELIFKAGYIRFMLEAFRDMNLTLADVDDTDEIEGDLLEKHNEAIAPGEEGVYSTFEKLIRTLWELDRGYLDEDSPSAVPLDVLTSATDKSESISDTIDQYNLGADNLVAQVDAFKVLSDAATEGLDTVTAEVDAIKSHLTATTGPLVGALDATVVATSEDVLNDLPVVLGLLETLLIAYSAGVEAESITDEDSTHLAAILRMMDAVEIMEVLLETSTEARWDGYDLTGVTANTAIYLGGEAVGQPVEVAVRNARGAYQELYENTLSFINSFAAEIKLRKENLEVILLNTNSIYAAITGAVNDQGLVLPPSGTMAGIYAAVDNDRGVWKAPANVSVNAVVGPAVKITAKDQEDLNVDVNAGKSINAIRYFTGKGTIVWGARTLAGNDNEWRYIPVRRLYNMVEESVKKATEFVVFEPNDKNTWVRTKAMIENFLNGIWKAGGLAGAKPEHAYYVNIGLNETMTAQDILEGRMIVEIGMAAVRPAEFIVLKFMHKLQES